jgi:parallel beta-helix repeat protein
MIKRTWLRGLTVLLVATLWAAASVEAQTTWYVDDDAPNDPGPGDPSVSDPLEDGSSEHPFDAIQEGIDAAADADTVLVLDGTYTGAGNRDLDFGGRLITVRSENGPENCIIDCQGSGRGFHFHSGETAASAAAGFTITSGYLFEEHGAGLYCVGSSPTIANCTIAGNVADFASGGGVCCSDSDATIMNCTITGNSHNGVACFGGGPTIANCVITENWTTLMVFGTGVVCWSSNAIIMNCTVAGNTGGVSGGGVCCFGGSPAITNSTVTGNWAYLAGGGIACWEVSSLTVSNCTIAGNTVDSDIGGGIYCWQSSTARITNCVIVRNGAYYGGGAIGCEESGSVIATNCTLAGSTVAHGTGGALCCRAGGSATIINCILWGDSPDEVDGPAVVTHSDIEGGLTGEGNIDADPLFVDPDGPDDDPNTFEDNDYRLSAGSPCIDAADNEAVPADTLDLDGDGDVDEPIPFDLDGNPRFVDDPNTEDTGNPDPGYPGLPIVDMGAYEFQVGLVAHLDIKPGSCPNPLNRRSHGVLPVAVVGTADFDVTQIDVDTLVLRRADGVGGSVTPLMGPPRPGIHVEDVATPFEGEPCECHELGGDGIDDLSMKFDTEAIVTELELNDLPGGATVELVVSGALSDGTPFTASDCIRLVPPGSGGGLGCLVVSDAGRNASPESRGAMSPDSFSTADPPQQDADQASGDTDANEEPQGALNAPIAACGAIPAAFLLAPIAALSLMRCRRR